MKYLLDGEETDRLLFRQISMDDYSEWIKFHEDPRCSEHWQWEKLDPTKECSNWYAKQYHRYTYDLGGMNALIEKSTGKFIGHCGLLIQLVDGVSEMEVGYSLLPEYWEQGFATEAAIKCKEYAFENNFTDSLISIISKSNVASQKVAAKNGMKVDKLTTYKDNEVFIFRIINNFIQKEMLEQKYS